VETQWFAVRNQGVVVVGSLSLRRAPEQSYVPPPLTNEIRATPCAAFDPYALLHCTSISHEPADFGPPDVPAGAGAAVRGA
jgi:hypothetical protein